MKRLDELGVSPAPWRVEGGPMAAIVYENKPTMKCGSVCALTGAQRNADAALIAAAPSLYEALTAMLSCAEKNAPYLCMSHMDIAVDMARKAIRKAGGEE